MPNNSVDEVDGADQTGPQSKDKFRIRDLRVTMTTRMKMWQSRPISSLTESVRTLSAKRMRKRHVCSGLRRRCDTSLGPLGPRFIFVIFAVWRSGVGRGWKGRDG